MNILDENILRSQRELLKNWRIAVYQIGYDMGRKGMQDDEILSFLHQQSHPTLFTRDMGLYEYNLCHKRYCIVCMAVDKHEVAVFVRRLLHHQKFNTQVKRMGDIVRLSQKGLWVWRLHSERQVTFEWEK